MPSTPPPYMHRLPCRGSFSPCACCVHIDMLSKRLPLFGTDRCVETSMMLKIKFKVDTHSLYLFTYLSLKMLLNEKKTHMPNKISFLLSMSVSPIFSTSSCIMVMAFQMTAF